MCKLSVLSKLKSLDRLGRKHTAWPRVRAACAENASLVPRLMANDISLVPRLTTLNENYNTG